MDNVTHLDKYRKIKSLETSIKELNEMCPVIKTSIINLTKYDNYSSMRRCIQDLFVLYQDLKRTKISKIETLERLKNE